MKEQNMCHQTCLRGLVIGIVGVAAICAGPALAQPVTIQHDGLLNWDIWNRTGSGINDLEILVEADEFAPSRTYDGPWGPPEITSPGNNTLIRWSGATVPNNTMFHVGVNMTGGGQILSCTQTLNGVEVAKVPIPFEITEIRLPGGDDPANVFMVFNTPQGFFDDNPSAVVTLKNIRTFIDLPESLLDLPDLNAGLDLDSLPNETIPVPNAVPLNAPGAETEVFVGQTYYSSPMYESLLYGEVFVDIDGPGSAVEQQAVSFWNLNPQSPEPATLILFILGGLAISRRRH